MHREPELLKDITDRLLSALQEDEFVLHSQAILPLIPQTDGRGFNEIFIRFQEEDEKLLPPGSFFPMLEEVGMLPFLDRWVINRLARFVRAGLSGLARIVVRPGAVEYRSGVEILVRGLLGRGRVVGLLLVREVVDIGH